QRQRAPTRSAASARIERVGTSRDRLLLTDISSAVDAPTSALMCSSARVAAGAFSMVRPYSRDDASERIVPSSRACAARSLSGARVRSAAVHSAHQGRLMSTLMEAWPRRHRISADEYCRMAEIGLLPPDARVELIDGEILDMPPIGKDHESVVDQLNHLFVRAVDDLAIVRVQGSVRLASMSMPQPDITLLKPRPDFYRSRRALE